MKLAARWRLLAGVVACALLCGCPGVARAAQFFSWSAPQAVDNDGGQFLTSLACPAAAQCTAVDASGRETTFAPGSPGTQPPVTVDPGANIWGLACPSATQCTGVDGFEQEVTFEPQSPGSPVPVTVDDAVMDAVACPSALQCTAVDQDGQEVTFNPAAPVNPQPIGVDAGNELYGVACPSVSQCTAADSVGQVVTFNPTSPGTPTPVKLSSATPANFLTAIACTSSSQCIAVGAEGFEATFDPSSPGSAQTATIDSGRALEALACQPAGDCTAVDGRGEEVTFNPALPGNPTPAEIDGDTFLTGVACPSASQCAAIDESGREVTFVPSPPSHQAGTGIDTGRPLAGVSCESASHCVAVDNVGQELAFDPSSPGTPTATRIDATKGGFNAVTCESATLCTAVDSQGNMVTFNPTSSAQITSASIDADTNVLNTVACPAADQCTATDSAGNEITFQPSNGDVIKNAAIDKGNDLYGLACPSQTQCSAVDGAGNLVTFTPATGTIQSAAAIDSGNVLSSVSCPGASQCTAVDHAGRELTFDPTSSATTLADVTPVAVDPDGELLSVDCVSESDCVAADFFGQAVEGDPQGDSPWTAEVLQNANSLYGLACPSTTECVAVDAAGNEFLGTSSGSAPVPVNAFAPSIFGTAQQGQQLSESHGSWSNSPTSFSYQWEDCAASGATNCVAISGATGQTYIPVASDLDHTLVVEEFAHNDGGSSDPASSNPTAVVLPAVPVNTTAPSISGQAREGDTLTEVHGAWTNSPTAYAYLWEDCNRAGANCTAIAGATDQTYTLTAADVGATIVVTETAINAGGSSQPASSPPTSTVAPLPPASVAPPSISGDATEGQTLTESHGTWSASPTAYTYQWEDCDTSGSSCTTIADAKLQTYVLTANDVGHTIRVQETASNGGGAGAQAISAQTAVVVAPAPAMKPASILVPVVSGKVRVGDTLTASTGAWSGTPPLSYTYQWGRCTRLCSPIAGAVGRTLELGKSYVDERLLVVVTATNSVGSAKGVSAEVGPTAPSGAAITAALRAVLVPSGQSALIGRLLAHDGYSFSFNSPSGGRLVISWSVGAGPAAKPRSSLVATLRATFTRASRATVKLVLTAAGRNLLGGASRLVLAATGEFTPTDAAGTALRRTFSITR